MRNLDVVKYNCVVCHWMSDQISLWVFDDDDDDDESKIYIHPLLQLETVTSVLVIRSDKQFSFQFVLF